MPGLPRRAKMEVLSMLIVNRKMIDYFETKDGGN